MSTNLPLGDYVRIALVTGVVLAAMILTANWLIENTLMPVLRGLWPVRGRHVADDYRPLDERIGAGDEEHERLLREEVYEADGGDTMHDDLADRERLTREHFDEWASGRFTHKGEDGEEDLTGLSEEDTDTLRVFHELNEQHVVPSHEPTPETSAPAHTGGGDDPGPGGPDDTDPPGVAAEEAPGPGDQPEDTPSPATQPANADNPTGPGAKSPGPAERGVISGSDGPVPARLPAGPGDTLSNLICAYQHAHETLLPAWESMLAEHIAEAMARLRAATAPAGAA